jgi:hypothetical protein
MSNEPAVLVHVGHVTTLDQGFEVHLYLQKIPNPGMAACMAFSHTRAVSRLGALSPSPSPSYGGALLSGAVFLQDIWT